MSELNRPPSPSEFGEKMMKPGWYCGRKRRGSWEAVSQSERWRRIPYYALFRFSGLHLDYDTQGQGWWAGFPVTVPITRLWSQIPRAYINVGQVWWSACNSSTHKHTQHFWNKPASQTTYVWSLKVRQGSWVVPSFTCLLEKSLESPRERELQLKNCPDQIVHGHVCETLSSLLTDVGVSGPLCVMLSLVRWAWVA